MFDWVLDLPILSVVCYLPLAGALVVILFMRNSPDRSVRIFTTAVVGIDFLISIPLWFAFDRQGDLFQFRESAEWIAARSALPCPTSRLASLGNSLTRSGWRSTTTRLAAARAQAMCM